MGETRYIVTVRSDASHALEVNLNKATRVIVGVHAQYPWGRGIDVLSVERAPYGSRASVMLWDGHDRAMCPDCEGRGTELSRLAEAIHGIADTDALTAQRLAGTVLDALAEMATA